MKFNVHAGHNTYSTGASSILNETNEVRKVKNKLINMLKENNHTVYDCTDEVGRTINDNLYNIVAKCNAHVVDLDVSIHLNSGRGDKKGDGSTGGVEVWVYDTSSKAYDEAKRICEKISKALGVYNRGVKISKDFYVLRNTTNPALLIECVFVDDKDDANRWNVDKCAKAIYEGLTNTTYTEPKPLNNVAVVKYMADDRKEYYMNVYEADKLEKTGHTGYYNSLLTIGTKGARNCYTTWDSKKKAASGKSKGSKKTNEKILCKVVAKIK